MYNAGQDLYRNLVVVVVVAFERLLSVRCRQKVWEDGHSHDSRLLIVTDDDDMPFKFFHNARPGLIHNLMPTKHHVPIPDSGIVSCILCMFP